MNVIYIIYIIKIFIFKICIINIYKFILYIISILWSYTKNGTNKIRTTKVGTTVV
jgi:uncharacterized protein YggT (Ycf19 family)